MSSMARRMLTLASFARQDSVAFDLGDNALHLFVQWISMEAVLLVAYWSECWIEGVVTTMWGRRSRVDTADFSENNSSQCRPLLLCALNG